jgi:1-aminocyclopropane-1-carboxylate deaminase
LIDVSHINYTAIPLIAGNGDKLVINIKRLDQLHPTVNGNKYYKLKYNIEKTLQLPHKTMLTFGGAHSNHIHATAAAGKLFGFKTIGIIRGEELENDLLHSSTLAFAKSCGMQLEFVTRSAYAEKETEDFKGWLHEQYGSFHLVPEGGSNFLGVNGCLEILSEEDKENYDIVTCACGTAATLAGIVLTLQPHQKALGFSVLKNGTWLKDEVIKHIQYFLMDTELANEYADKFEIITPYDFGGYAKSNPKLIDFIIDFEKKYGVPLDQVYTGKMMYGLVDLIQKNEFANNQRILAIHTGGLQGRSF